MKQIKNQRWGLILNNFVGCYALCFMVTMSSYLKISFFESENLTRYQNQQILSTGFEKDIASMKS